MVGAYAREGVGELGVERVDLLASTRLGGFRGASRVGLLGETLAGLFELALELFARICVLHHLLNELGHLALVLGGEVVQRGAGRRRDADVLGASQRIQVERRREHGGGGGGGGGESWGRARYGGGMRAPGRRGHRRRALALHGRRRDARLDVRVQVVLLVGWLRGGRHHATERSRRAAPVRRRRAPRFLPRGNIGGVRPRRHRQPRAPCALASAASLPTPPSRNRRNARATRSLEAFHQRSIFFQPRTEAPWCVFFRRALFAPPTRPPSTPFTPRLSSHLIASRVEPLVVPHP